ncbi:MAG TPA: hypothetical protein VFT63_07035 [bacterium]|nr:hypothetical protein [bacterium]
MRYAALVAIVIAAVSVSGCLQALGLNLAGAGSSEVWDVVPGKSAGPVKIGMRSIDVHRALGVPKESKSGMREVWMYPRDLMVAFDTDSKVAGVQMIRPGRVQWKGRTLDVSHSGKDAVNIFGDPDFVSHWTHDSNDGVQYVVYGYRSLGFGVLAHPKTDKIVGYIIAEPEEGPAASESAPDSSTPPPPAPPSSP